MQNKINLLISTGGSTQGAGLLGAQIGVLQAGFRADIIAGTSVSAITAIHVAMGLFDQAKEVMTTFTQKDIFGNYPPIGKNGKRPSPIALLRMLAGRASLGKQDALRETIKKYLDKPLFLKWQADLTKADVVVFYVDMNSGLLTYRFLRFLKYNKALDAIMASSNIPILIDAQKIDHSLAYDGGLLDPNGSSILIEKYGSKIDTLVSIYNRDTIKKTQFKMTKYWRPKGFFKWMAVAGRCLQLVWLNQSFKAEQLEDLLCQKYNIRHRKIHFVTELDSLYDADQNELIADFNHAHTLGFNSSNNG